MPLDNARRRATTPPLLIGLGLLLLAGCANTQYRPFETKDKVFEGRGGAPVVFDDMEIWENGEPPRRFTVLGFIVDSRGGGVLQLSQLRKDMVGKSREFGGDALIQLNDQSQLVGYETSGVSINPIPTLQKPRVVSKFAVIKFVK